MADVIKRADHLAAVAAVKREVLEELLQEIQLCCDNAEETADDSSISEEIRDKTRAMYLAYNWVAMRIRAKLKALEND